MSTSNTTRPKTTESGAPHYPNLWKDLSEEHIALQNDYRQLLSHNEQLEVEASQSVCNLQERNYYKLCSWGWGTAAVLLAASWIIFAVKL